MQNLNVCLLQTDILWENRDENLRTFTLKLDHLKAQADLIVLPEMFATGFSMNSAVCAEAEDGPTLAWMKTMAQKHQCDITGSAMIEDGNLLYNRLFWVKPDGSYNTYNKRHLFRFGREHEYYASGSEKLIVDLKGWKICPLVCYDLRFPVWAKNTYKNHQFEYDCLIYIANWPERRAHHWKSLLMARAIENLSYCIGVNRVGIVGNELSHAGNSMLADPLGQLLHPLKDHQEGLIETVLDSTMLTDWRGRFNVGQDWDSFQIL